MPEPLMLGSQLGAARSALLALALVLTFATEVAAQASQKEAPASVSGRVTDGERGIAGVTLVIMSTEPQTRFRPVARGRTDSEGRYRVTGVPPGRYNITPAAPAYVFQDLNSYPPGKPLMLSAGDSAEDVDFRAVRGGVITGKVTDADGNPIIAEMINVIPADPKPNQQMNVGIGYGADQRDLSTDDRGVYRIYGLQPGRYRVSVGSDTRTFRAPGSKYYRRTFYPSEREESKGKVVEVTAGGVAEDVDITLGEAEKTFRASGRFVQAETGQGVVIPNYGYGMLDPASGRLNGEFTGASTNARGEFQLTGLAPGRYRIFTFGDQRGATELYSEPADFEISDTDVSGVVVKLKRGCSVSGVVVVEGLSDRAAAARLVAGTQVYARSQQGRGGEPVPGYVAPSPVAADGSFRLTGIQPGKLLIYASGMTKGLSFGRVELNGAEQRDGVVLVEGGQVAGIRIVMLYGSGVMRGQLSFPDNAAPPQNMRMVVIVRRVGAPDGRGSYGVEADARGRFQIDSLPAGEYEVQGRAFGPGGAFQSESQRVSLSESGEVTVSLTLAPMGPRSVTIGGGGTP
jgi:Carboxypeptidase regulatory-like domain